MPLITIRVSPQESARVARLARTRKVSRSEVVRQALASLDSGAERSALDDWQGAVGLVDDAPKDLSTNPKHLKGFGR